MFLPLGAMLTLDAFEHRLLQAQERSMVQQGRLVAAALADPLEVEGVAQGIRRESAFGLLWRLQQRTTSRIRILDRDGVLLADSSALGPRLEVPPSAARQTPGSATAQGTGAVSDPRSRWLYRAGALPFRLWQRLRSGDLPEEGEPDTRLGEGRWGPEVYQALAGRYGARSRRVSGERALLLYSAIPVRAVAPLRVGLGSTLGNALSHDAPEAAAPEPLSASQTVEPTGVEPGGVLGVVLVSQSTVQVLSDLDQARIEVGQVLLGSLLVAALLNFALAMTIASPLRRLRREAEGLLDARGRLVGDFEPSRRHDEIGDLRDTLGALAGRLRKQQQTAESFAADVAHEIKNPLAAIRSATEVLANVDEPEQRQRFGGLIQSNIARAEHVLSSLRELAAIDVGLEEDLALAEMGADASVLPKCELVALVRLMAGNRSSAGDLVELEAPKGLAFVRGRPERLEQVVDNLLENALSFSPEGEPVRIKIHFDASNDSQQTVILQVSDRGPGLPDRDFEAIFRRFYSYRPGDASSHRPEAHAGLGLAIVRSIVEAYGGSVLARNAAGGGAVFECRLPAIA